MKRYLLLMAFLCAVWRAGAQVMVSGRVVDANDGLELMGCTVAEKDATNRVVGGMTTDMNGNFAFKVKNVNNKLVFTFMGYKTQEFPIGSQRKFNVKMEDNTMKVSEVVVKAQKRGPDGAFNTATGGEYGHDYFQDGCHGRSVCSRSRRCFAGTCGRFGHRGRRKSRFGQSDAYPWNDFHYG